RITMERITPIYSGSDPNNWGNNNQVDINGIDAGGNPVLGTPKATNSLYQAPPDTISIRKFNVPEANAYKGAQNISIHAFKASDTKNHFYTITKLSNTSSIAYPEVTNISVYKDIDANHLYNAGDVLVEKLSNAGRYWSGIQSLAPETNYVITMSVGTNVTFGHTFIARLQQIHCDGGLYSSGYVNAYPQRIISRPPAIGLFSIIPGSVTNMYRQPFSLSAVLTNKGDGITNVHVLFQGHETEYTNYTLHSSAGTTNYRLVNALIPNNVDVTNYTMVLLASDGQDYAYLSSTTSMTIKGNRLPKVYSYTAVPSLLYATGSSNVTFQAYSRDRDAPFTNITSILDLSLINGNTAVTMNNLSGRTQWQYIYTIPASVTPGVKSVTLKVIDDLGGFRSTNISLTILSHTPPLANAGKDTNVNGGTVMTLPGEATAYDGAVLTSYTWTVITNTTGESTDLVAASSLNPSISLPNTTGRIVLNFQVKDSWNTDSNLDQIVLNVNKAFPADLKNACPFNTVIKAGEDQARFINLSRNTKISVYTITGNKVAEVAPANDTELIWHIPDSVASGVYVVYMKDAAGHTKKVKIIIIR
ncbi:MAG: T9SS type A sorting domain-containing protein, partial [bacterium]|nr:T9SS type A sorting domain-containing protein [bacterium]